MWEVIGTKRQRRKKKRTKLLALVYSKGEARHLVHEYQYFLGPKWDVEKREVQK